MSLSTNLVSYYKLDESSGNAADSVGGVTLTNTGSATYAAGLINNGVSLNGTSQYLTAADNATTDTPTSAITISAWFKASSSLTIAPLVTKNYTTGWANPYASWLLRIDTSTKIELGLNIVGTYTAIAPTVSTLSTGTWYHVVGVYDGAHISIYLNGVSQGTPVAATGSIAYSTGSLDIGHDNGAEFAGGIIDEVGIWSRALSGSEISQLYNSGAGLQYPFTVASTANPAFLLRMANVL